MATLTISITSGGTDTGLDTVHLFEDGVTDLKFSFPVASSRLSVLKKIGVALELVPDDAEMSVSDVRALIAMILSEQGHKNIASDALKVPDELSKMAGTMEIEFRNGFEIFNVGTRLVRYLNEIGCLTGGEEGLFTFSDFLEGKGVLYDLYSETKKNSFSKAKAINFISKDFKKNHPRYEGLGPKSFSHVVGILRDSGFNIGK